MIANETTATPVKLLAKATPAIKFIVDPSPDKIVHHLINQTNVKSLTLFNHKTIQVCSFRQQTSNN